MATKEQKLLREKLLKLHHITSATVHANGSVSIKTDTIHMDDRELGEFKITLRTHGFSLNSMISIKNLTRLVNCDVLAGPTIYFHHPHVWGKKGRPTHTCIGPQLETPLINILKNKQFDLAIIYILSFLERGYGWVDISKGAFLSRYPKKKIVELEATNEI
jgi:hypothetical protein